MKVAVFIISLLLLAGAQSPVQAENSGNKEPENHGLVLRGQVVKLEVEQKRDAVLFHVQLNVRLVNEGTKPIILFKPSIDSRFEKEGRYWLGGWSLYLTEGAKDSKAIFADGYWESVIGSDFYRTLAGALDVKTPPADYTRTLQPGETWEFPDEFRIYFEAEKHTRWPEHKTWKEMQNYPAQVWLRIAYELSPWNIEFFKPDLLRKLSKRWDKFGTVLVKAKREGRFNHFGITSEPMSLDFSQAKIKEPTSVVEKD
jgi:hypothetical protein